MEIPETSELQAFVRIADAGSVTGAARDLGLPRATVGRRLARLEERLGVRLVHRTTRRLQLTEAGEEYYTHARGIVVAVQAASFAIRRDDGRPSGLLRISVPPMGDRGLRQLLLDFMAAYPEIVLEVSSSTRHEDLVAGNIDLAWRAGIHFDPGLVARKLMASEMVAVAAPGYLDRAGVPADLANLADHDCLLGFTRGERPATHWPLRNGGQIRVGGRLVSNEMALLMDAARAGLGIAMVPAPYLAPHIRDGSLVPVLEPLLGTPTHVALVYTDRRLLKPAARAFVDFVLGRIPITPC